MQIWSNGQQLSSGLALRFEPPQSKHYSDESEVNDTYSHIEFCFEYEMHIWCLLTRSLDWTQRVQVLHVF